jgi:hypothetical protein
VSAANGVLANDRDPDGNPITASVVSGTTNGALVFNNDGSFTYTPNSGFTGRQHESHPRRYIDVSWMDQSCAPDDMFVEGTAILVCFQSMQL